MLGNCRGDLEFRNGFWIGPWEEGFPDIAGKSVRKEEVEDLFLIDIPQMNGQLRSVLYLTVLRGRGEKKDPYCPVGGG